MNSIGSATTAGDGGYNLTVAYGVAPCMLQVEIMDGRGTVTDRLHGYATAAGIANITPLTDVVLALALDTEDLSDAFATFSSITGALKPIQSSEKLVEAWKTVKAQLIARGVDVSAIQSDPFTHAFKADAANVGIGHDAVLDALQGKNLSRHYLYVSGGGASTGGGSASPITTFVTGNSVETAYFSNSYEVTDSGYVHNAIGSTGAGGRYMFTNSAGSYSLDTGNEIFQVGLINGKEGLLDRWLTASGVQYKNIPNGFSMSVLGALDVIRLNSIQETILDGRSFSDVLPENVLKSGTVSGTFPVGSRAYEASLTSLQDVYLMPNGSGFESGSTDAGHMHTFHNTANTAVCIGDGNALVFTSPTQATQHPILSSSGGDCLADTANTIATLTVTSRMLGNDRRIFEFGDAAVDVTNYGGVWFNYKGVRQLKFFLYVEDATRFGLSQEVVVKQGYYFPAGSTGTRLVASAMRLNKTALNAVLRAKGQPGI
jgi:hypothetical protein